MTYIRRYLDQLNSNQLVDDLARKEIATNSSTLTQIEQKLNQLLDRLHNLSTLDQVLNFVSNNKLQIIGFVASIVVGTLALRSFSTAFASSRSDDLQRINALEGQVQALADKTRDLSLQLSGAEQALNRNQQVAALQFVANNERQAIVSTDIANIGAAVVD